ncbi:type IV pilus assembly protein PilM [Candidatus Kaiserbacteria bacterium]|nr:type IV pilus assembly protein PilM [Candidatus Kaiserbacteria bacterium]
MAFSLGKILQGLSGGDESVIGIDIGSSSIKIVQLRASRGVAVLETYGEISLGPYAKQEIGKMVKLSPEQTAEAIKDLMREANVTARSAGVSIPFSSSLVSVLVLPDVDKESLKRIVPIEARKYIPVPITEVTIDWFVIPREEGEQSAFDQIQKEVAKGPKQQEVLLVAIQNSTLRGYQTLTAAAGVNVSFYEIEIFSAIRSVVDHGVAPILIVDIGAATTKIYVVERGVVRLTHLTTIGSQHMTEVLARSMGWEFDKAERIKRERGLVSSTAFSSTENEQIKTALLSTLSRIFSEVNRVLLSYGQRYNKNVAHVVLTGGGASLPGLSGVAKTSLNVEARIANPFAHTEAPAFLDTVLRDIGPGFAVAIGLALRKLRRE